MRCLVFLLVFVAAVEAQEFEAVSVRQLSTVEATDAHRAMGYSQWGPGTTDPTRITYIGNTFLQLLMSAYSVPSDQVRGPSWISDGSYRYHINARVPPETTKEGAALMLRKVLSERFALLVHKESKQVDGWDLAVGPKGSKLKPSAN